MKIEILRDHLDYKAGDTPTDLTDDQKNYLIAQGVAKIAGSKTDSPSQQQKEEQDAAALADKNKRQAAAKTATTPLKSAAKKGKK
jgi:ribosomal protein L9